MWGLLNPGMICPHPARAFGSGSPLPNLGEGLGVRARSMLHTQIQQRRNLGIDSIETVPTRHILAS